MPDGRLGRVEGAFACLSGLVVISVSGVLCHVLDPDPLTARVVSGLLVGAALLVATGSLLVPTSEPTTRRAAVRAGTGAGIACAAAAAVILVELHGTRWGLYGLAVDGGFRTQLATSYAASPALADAGYQGLPAFYPPLLHWLEGRTAAVLQVPAWTTLKWFQVVTGLVAPLGALVWWRRFLAPRAAVLATSLSCLVAALPDKPDEWLVLVWVLPWWLCVFRQSDGVSRSVPRLALHGLFAGALLATYSFYFTCFALATVVAPVAHGREPGWGRRAVLPPLVVGVVGAVAASPSWLPVLAASLAGDPHDDLYLRYHDQGIDDLPLPLPLSAAGLVTCVGTVWILLRLRRRDVPGRLARDLAVVAAVGYAVLAASKVGARLGVSFLGFKAQEIVLAALAAAAGVAAVEVAGWARGRSGPLPRPVHLALVGCLALGGVLAFRSQMTDEAALVAAHAQRYPDGSFPEDRYEGALDVAWESPSTGPSVHRLAAAVHAASDGTARPVVLTAREDLMATNPFWGFVAWSAHFSNPLGRHSARIAFSRSVAGGPSGAALAHALRHNPFDPVDVLVLRATANGWLFLPKQSAFPSLSVARYLYFEPAQFASGGFDVRRLGDWVVIGVPRR